MIPCHRHRILRADYSLGVSVMGCNCRHGQWYYQNADGSPAKIYELQTLIDELWDLIEQAERFLAGEGELSTEKDYMAAYFRGRGLSSHLEGLK